MHYGAMVHAAQYSAGRGSGGTGRAALKKGQKLEFRYGESNPGLAGLMLYMRAADASHYTITDVPCLFRSCGVDKQSHVRSRSGICPQIVRATVSSSFSMRVSFHTDKYHEDRWSGLLNPDTTGMRLLQVSQSWKLHRIFHGSSQVFAK
jgi:hypothetical protein